MWQGRGRRLAVSKQSETLSDLEFGSKIAKVLTKSDLTPPKIF